MLRASALLLALVGSSSCTTEQPWVAVGQGELELEDAEELVMSIDGSGCGGPLQVFALTIRAGGFRMSANMPLLDLKLDVEGVEGGYAGHFARVANYGIPFEGLDEHSYEFRSVNLFVPELEDPCVLDEQPARLYGQLGQLGGEHGETVEIDLDVTLEVPEALGFDCTD